MEDAAKDGMTLRQDQRRPQRIKTCVTAAERGGNCSGMVWGAA
jgi:hypothetical protein